jgi:hypothetical protein
LPKLNDTLRDHAFAIGSNVEWDIASAAMARGDGAEFRRQAARGWRAARNRAILEQLSVLLDCETIQGNSQDGVIDNRGLIVSRGGAHNGAGGDVMFHARQPNGEDFTVSGPTDQRGDGTGLDGVFAGE